MQRPNFAVTLAHMSARIEFRSIRPGQEVTVGAVRIRAGALNHPQGCLGYRISVGASSFVSATDTEPLAPGGVDPAVLDLARRADLLIHDSQYIDDEYEGRTSLTRRGWGHSSFRLACRVARSAAVKQLALFHHDPPHDDRVVGRIVEDARALFPNVIAAREGMTTRLPLAVQEAGGARRGTPRAGRGVQRAPRPVGDTCYFAAAR